MRLGELQRLLKEHEPLGVCLQHTNGTIPSIGNYHLASHSVPTNGSLGTAIYIHHKVTYDTINITSTEFQISGVKLHLKNNSFTLYNLYNQPAFNYDLGQLPNFIPNIKENFILVGDFNAHSPLWDTNYVDADNNGLKIEQALDKYNLCLLNEAEVSTYYSKSHGSFSSIDLTICSPSIVDRFEWSVLDDFYSSDHSPILISCIGHTDIPNIQRYNTDKADWKTYELYTRQAPVFNQLQNHNDTADVLTDFITTAADQSIPKTSIHPPKHSVPWWSDTLNQLIKDKHTIGRKLETLNKRFKLLSLNPLLMEIRMHKLVDLAIEISVLKPYYKKLNASF